MTVLVTGATGNVGGATVRALVARGEHVRALVRDPQRGRERLGGGVELVIGDFSDRPSVRRAMRGVDRLLLSSADGPDKVAHETAVVDEAVAAGVELIVKASALRAQSGSPLPPFDWNGRIEDHVRQAWIPAVNLRAGFYMTNLLAAAQPVRDAGALFAPAGTGAVAMIDPRDVGAVAAAVLTGKGHEGRDYVLTGAEAITYEQVAEALGAATRRPVAYVDVPPQAAREALAASGAPAWLVEHLDLFFELVRRGELEETTDTVRMLTGREPRSFAAFARDHAGLFEAGAAAAVGA